MIYLFLPISDLYNYIGRVCLCELHDYNFISLFKTQTLIKLTIHCI